MHVVPLSGAALGVLERAQLLRGPVSDIVFPGQNPKRNLSDMTLLKVLRDRKAGVTRYDKLAANFLSGVALATAFAFWL